MDKKKTEKKDVVMNDELNMVVIIPVHVIDEDVKTLLPDAINSVPKDIQVRISCANGIAGELAKMTKKNKNVVIYEAREADKTSFPELVNQAIGGSKYFSILEFDDEYTPIWYDNFKAYVDAYPDVSIFLYLEDIVDFNEKKYIGFGNEAPLASSFSNVLGEIDNDCLQEFFDFYLTGSVFKTEDFENVGKLKTNLPLVFWYEFLLRTTNKQNRVMVIPKVGYVHYLGRKNSITENYRETISEKESEYWFNVAKKESFHKTQREVKPFKSEED